MCPDTVCARRMCVVRGQEDDVVGTRGQGLEAHIHMQCSRLKPLFYGFPFEGLSNLSPSVEALVQIQDVNPRI